MEDVGNAPHLMGSGQARAVNHTRPFFYVQPPSQPYCMYQWQTNNPFSHYGMSGSGIPFGRPYLAPYPYMHYPGYIMPHAPMPPVDYRRIFNPHFPLASTYDVRFRHHYHHHQTRMRRETACSEVQTEPSDLVNELIESFSKLASFRSAHEVEKELDSGVVSQASVMCADSGHGEKSEGLSGQLEPLPQRQKPSRYVSSMPAALLIEPIAAAFDVDSSQSPLEEPPHHSWTISNEEVLPLDSSSVHEVAEEEEEELVEDCVPEKPYLSLRATAKVREAGRRKVCSESHRREMRCNVQGTIPAQLVCSSPLVPERAEQISQKACQKSSLTHAAKGKGLSEKPTLDVDVPYQILRLPCDKVAAATMLQKGSPLWCVDSALMPPSSYLSSFGNALYYSHYPQTSQERQSVLSPSLDEMSSRDELFSTDLEDLDLMCGHMYMGGGRVAHNTRETPGVGEGADQVAAYQDACTVCTTRMCSVCGTRLSKAGQRGAVAGKEETDEETAEEEDGSEVPKHACKLQMKRLLPAHQSHIQKEKRRSCEGAMEQDYLESQEQGYLGESECCEEHKGVAKVKRPRDQEPKCALLRPCLEKHWREEPVLSEHESWESPAVGQRQVSAKPCPSRGLEKPTRRRTSCKTSECQRPRSNDHEFPPCQKGRGSTKRGTRC